MFEGIKRWYRGAVTAYRRINPPLDLPPPVNSVKQITPEMLEQFNREIKRIEKVIVNRNGKFIRNPVLKNYDHYLYYGQFKALESLIERGLLKRGIF